MSTFDIIHNAFLLQEWSFKSYTLSNTCCMQTTSDKKYSDLLILTKCLRKPESPIVFLGNPDNSNTFL